MSTPDKHDKPQDDPQDELDLDPETVTDLDVDPERADGVRGGACPYSVVK